MKKGVNKSKAYKREMATLWDNPQSFAADSFFTLSVLERVGLVALSLGMLAVLALCVCLAAKRLGLFAVLIAVPAYWIFVWLAPQVYYLYYIAIFEGLPWQWVIGAPLGLGAFMELVTLQARNSLSEISQGIGFWFVVLSGLICARWRLRVRG